MKILAIDYGTKNIGLAYYNKEVDVILPCGQVNNMDEVVNFIKQWGVEQVIVGLPLGLDSKGNKNTKRIKNFVRELKNKTGLEIKLTDERFSSQQADRMGQGVSRDEKSAMIIMQSYLNSINPKII
ncbi:MAG: Holliday junction resolvase RuvX [bacterium]